MISFYIIILGLLLGNNQLAEAAAFTAPSPTATQLQTVQAEAFQSVSSLSDITTNLVNVQYLTSLPPLSRVTPPPSLHHLELRQRCWNDQGFSVDCAVWTGYRYTWGPATNPYDYWSGAGGSGSGGGGLVSGAASKVAALPKGIAIALAVNIALASLA